LACKARHRWIPTKQIDGYDKCCNQLDLGLLVVIDQESGNRPCLLANTKWARRPLVQSRNPQAIYTNNWT
jgi:hypothetical protein